MSSVCTESWPKQSDKKSTAADDEGSVKAWQESILVPEIAGEVELSSDILEQEQSL